ncbi:hypothetical protein [Pedobacter sp. FW305-3-2-15-E-R2A2]|uniref:hypothetical protein n=1 Tax=Pedobacter sp. FW305-3-2-15-E-R2A2 TaxID=3140251 RepID=UPI003140B817
MLRFITLILSSTLFFSTCFSQQNQKPLLTGDILKDLNNLLPQAEVTVDIFDGIKQSKRQAELMEKFKLGVQKNYDWFIDHTKKFENVRPLPYHPNLGLTEGEYIEMQRAMKEMESSSSGSEVVSILNNNIIISFKSRGRLAILDAVRIDLEKNLVFIGDHELNFTGKSDITNESNGLRSKWKGYNWDLELPKNISPDQFKDLENLNAKFYKLTIGRLEKNGKTFLQIKGKEFEKGKAKVSFDIPLVF